MEVTTYLKQHGIGYEVEVMGFPISLEEAITRDYNRHPSSRVGRTVIEQQYEQWLEFYEGVEHGG